MLFFLAFPTPCTTWVLPQINTSHEVFQKDSATPTTTTITTTTPSSSNSNTTSSSSSRISPAVLFIIVILAVIFFISGLLHLLLRFLIKKKNPSSSSSPSSSPPNPQNHGSPNSDAIQRQLQQLFHLHDSGLDQAFIDALPVFLYLEIVGSKEPFDCAVCLCEFSQEDKLRLLPVCGHAFHLNCIDTWLLSNSTCPLCRGALFLPGGATDNPMYDFEEEVRLEEGCVGVVPVRLGKFRSTSNRNAGCEIDGDRNGSSIIRREEGESSSSKLDARRCYSMGSFQYVVGDADLRVALSIRDANGRRIREGGGEYEEGKRIGVRSKGESFSVSKIWLWGSKKDKYRVSVDTSSLDGGLPWMARRSVEDSS